MCFINAVQPTVTIQQALYINGKGEQPREVTVKAQDLAKYPIHEIMQDTELSVTNNQMPSIVADFTQLLDMHACR